MWLLRAISSLAFLTSIIVSIPLGFDVGGHTCGLAFSLALATFYFYFSLLRLITPSQSRIRLFFVYVLSLSQWIVLPTLLIWCLNRFQVDQVPSGRGDWLHNVWTDERSSNTSHWQWLFGSGGLTESATIVCWNSLLRWSTPVFQLVEGFCSLLVIQAAGQITRHTVNHGRRADSWMIGFLVLSASIISSAVYYLWRIIRFPEISSVDAILIGITVTCATFLCAWGIGSGKGNPVESSLLFAYIVLCIYQIFTDYQPSHPMEPAVQVSQSPDFPPFPPIIMASYTTLHQLLSILPVTIHAGFSFLAAAIATVTPSILISLAYRIFVLYASTRIIPSIRASGTRTLAQEPSLEDADGAGRALGFLSWFSPSIVITVYTSLLMQHFASTNSEADGMWWTHQGGDLGSSVWRWVNIVGTMTLYAVELSLSRIDIEGGIATHWKID